MPQEHRIVDVTPDNVDEFDLFCKKSKKEYEGYQKKLKWFNGLYDDGLRIKLLMVSDQGRMTSRGFIEYIPGEHAWRAVNARSYMVIHCLWVVGKWKKKGFGTRLLETCVEDARMQGKKGVAMVASDRPWLTGKKLLIKNGFDVLDSAPPSFELIVRKFNGAQSPSFPTDWGERVKKFGPGLTVTHTAQCPYQPEAVKMILETAIEEGFKAKAVELKSAREVQEKSPSAYGVFGIVYDGSLLSYYYLNKKQLLERIQNSV
jgi:GNAT superfamily N-acetyltransferase